MVTAYCSQSDKNIESFRFLRVGATYTLHNAAYSRFLGAPLGPWRKLSDSHVLDPDGLRVRFGRSLAITDLVVLVPDD